MQHTVFSAEAGASLGAADFTVVVDILRQVQPLKGSKLALLGDDVGAAAVAAGLLFDFKSVLVVEPGAVEHSQVQGWVTLGAILLSCRRAFTKPCLCCHGRRHCPASESWTSTVEFSAPSVRCPGICRWCGCSTLT